MNQKDQPPISTKVINDPIYGHIELDCRLFQIMDTPIFQRLRDLKQLGGMYFVFPGAAHNRFEHSVGTAYLAGEWIKHLQEKQPELGITNEDKHLVQVAALCHDLGHGPFSHMFQDIYIKNNIQFKEWSHEKMSCALLRLINKSLPFEDRLREDQILCISNMIMGKVPENLVHKTFLYRIVCNTLNSIDVDKLDYLVRDTKSVGLPLGFEVARIIGLSRVINNEICYDERGAMNIAQLFVSRYSLHKDVYSHTVVEAIELMIGDILHYTSDHLQIPTIIQGTLDGDEDMVRKYVLLTDSILKEIERVDLPNDPNISKAKVLIERIQTRKHYKFLGRFNLAPDFNEVNIQNNVNSLKSYLDKHQHRFHTNKLAIVKKRSIDFAMKNRNPLSSVEFFSAGNKERAFFNRLEEISPIFSSNVQENIVRIYYTGGSNEQEKVDLVAYLNEFSDDDSNGLKSRFNPSPKAPKPVKKHSTQTNVTYRKLADEFEEDNEGRDATPRTAMKTPNKTSSTRKRKKKNGSTSGRKKQRHQ